MMQIILQYQLQINKSLKMKSLNKKKFEEQGICDSKKCFKF